MVEYPSVGDKQTHGGQRRFVLARKNPNDNLPFRISIEHMLQSAYCVPPQHLRIIDLDLKEVRTPIIINDPVIRATTIITDAKRIESCSGLVMNSLPDALMRTNLTELFAVAHGFIPCRHGTEEPTQHSYHPVVVANHRLVRFPDSVQQV